MKYCPYCGASVADGTVSFCIECGKGLPTATPKENLKDEVKKSQSTPKKRPSRKEKKKARHLRADSESFSKAQIQQDDSYDGYYADVVPVDAGKLREGMDWALIKRISMVVAGVLLVVILCVVAMYLL